MEKLDLKVVARTSLGSGASGRYRRQGKVPAVLYGHGEPKPILVDATELGKILLKPSGRNVILSLLLDNSTETAIIRDIQRVPVTRKLSHIDFQRISLTERISANVNVVVIGESEAVKAGGILMTLMHKIEIESLPMDIPDSISVDISVLKQIGDALHASDLVLPAGVELKSAPDATVVTVQPPEKEEEKPAEAAVEGAESAEPEVIAKGKEKEGAEPAADGKAAPGAKAAPAAAAKDAAPKAKGKEK